MTDSERAKAEDEGELPREALPVLTATRLGKGVEIRVGLTQWAQRAGTDAEVAQITRNIVDILRRVRPKVRRRDADDPELGHPQRGDREQLLRRQRQRRPLRRRGVELRLEVLVLRPPVPELRARVAGEQRAGEEELERVQDRHRGGRARQLHALGLTHRRAGRDGRHHARERQPRRIDRHDPRRAQQLAHGLLEMEALERPGQQQDEERLVHRVPDAIASALVADVDDLVYELRSPEGDPAGAIVLLHGRGTSEQDLIPLLDVFDPHERLVGAFPRGPLQLPPIGSHWYVVEEVGYPDPESFRATFDRLGSWLEGLAERTGVPIERTVLGGFSQGAVMAWALALGPGRPRPAGILAMSGFIPTVPDFELQLDGLRGFPVAITHGTEDPVISVELGRQARDRAQAAGAEVAYRETDVPHIVDPRLIPGLVDWLDKRFD